MIVECLLVSSPIGTESRAPGHRSSTPIDHKPFLYLVWQIRLLVNSVLLDGQGCSLVDKNLGYLDKSRQNGYI
jgi:hypothetical protein